VENAGEFYWEQAVGVPPEGALLKFIVPLFLPHSAKIAPNGTRNLDWASIAKFLARAGDRAKLTRELIRTGDHRLGATLQLAGDLRNLHQGSFPLAIEYENKRPHFVLAERQNL